jgi:predicted Zn finger-like uncharacterized protein
MDIFCPSCQTKLQIADSHAGQAVKCPSCAASFQAPSLPSTAPLPAPEPLAPHGSDRVKPEAAFGPPPEGSQRTAAAPHGFEPVPQAPPTRDYSRTTTILLRHGAVTMIAPVGLFILLFVSFFPWRPAADWLTLDRFTEWTTLNLWQLAFTKAGSAIFLLYVLLLLIAAPIVWIMPLLQRNLLPTPAPLRPYLPWGPLVVANLTLAAWVFFLIHYLQCTFIDPIDPATIWMKLAFRLHTLIVIAAFADMWLVRRQGRGLPEPSFIMRW